MRDEQLKSLPGAEIVLPGLTDLEAGRESVNALAVQSAAPRLRALGLPAASAEGDTPAAHALYARLSEELGDAAHSRYNASLASPALRERRRYEDQVAQPRLHRRSSRPRS
jgi:hypothetical protein